MCQTCHAKISALRPGTCGEKSSHFLCVMNEDKSGTKGRERRQPNGVLKVEVRVLRAVVGEARLLVGHLNCKKVYNWKLGVGKILMRGGRLLVR